MAGVRKTTETGEARGVVYQLHGARVKVAPPEPASDADSAGITDAGRELVRANAAVEAAAEVRSKRVRALKEKIARGEYNPDPREVARELLERGF